MRTVFVRLRSRARAYRLRFYRKDHRALRRSLHERRSFGYSLGNSRVRRAHVREPRVPSRGIPRCAATLIVASPPPPPPPVRHVRVQRYEETVARNYLAT